ncbi:hypothetical protein ACLOJK_010743 [Asimina triloba]
MEEPIQLCITLIHGCLELEGLVVVRMVPGLKEELLLRCVEQGVGGIAFSGRDRSQCLSEAATEKVALQIDLLWKNDTIELTHCIGKLKVEFPLVVADALDEARYIDLCKQAGDLASFPIEANDVAGKAQHLRPFEVVLRIGMNIKEICRGAARGGSANASTNKFLHEKKAKGKIVLELGLIWHLAITYDGRADIRHCGMAGQHDDFLETREGKG